MDRPMQRLHSANVHWLEVKTLWSMADGELELNEYIGERFGFFRPKAISTIVASLHDRKKLSRSNDIAIKFIFVFMDEKSTKMRKV